MRIREFDQNTDLGAVCRCLVELQDYERRLDPRMPPGAQIVDEYVANMLRQCEQYDGRILVAMVDGDIVGYATILTSIRNEELEDGDYEYGLVSDLVVLEPFRNQGVGRELLAAAESHARREGVEWLRIGVLSDNGAALDFYRSLGFADRYTELEKGLGDSDKVPQGRGKNS